MDLGVAQDVAGNILKMVLARLPRANVELACSLEMLGVEGVAVASGLALSLAKRSGWGGGWGAGARLPFTPVHGPGETLWRAERNVA